MSEFVAKLVNIEEKEVERKDGTGTYPAYVVNYSVKGEPRSKALAKGFVDKNLQLKAGISSVKAGDMVKITLDGYNFVNIQKNVPSTSSSSSGSSGSSWAGKKSSSYTKPPFNEDGMYVCNALNNATLRMANKVNKHADLLEEVMYVLEVADKALAARKMKTGTLSDTELPLTKPVVAKKTTVAPETSSNTWEEVEGDEFKWDEE